MMLCAVVLVACGGSSEKKESSELKITKNVKQDAKTYVRLTLEDVSKGQLYYDAVYDAYGEDFYSMGFKRACFEELNKKINNYSATLDPLKDASFCATYALWDYHDYADIILRDFLWAYQDRASLTDLKRFLSILSEHCSESWIEEAVDKYLY